MTRQITEVETPRETFLNSPLTSEDQLRSEYRKRRSVVQSRTAHPADVVELAKLGWTVRKSGKRTATLVKNKSLDQLLEDRIWCLARQMGYQRMNGGHLNVDFRREDGSTDRKQIEVFALDGETALIFECKFREERGRKNLAKDLDDSNQLKDFVRQCTLGFSLNSKPKIVWVYATQNIIWSESDLQKASDLNISVITENEIQYFEAFLRHMGPAGRYQILGEFLRGQKVPGLEGVKVPAIKGRVAGETFYSFVATPRNLLRIAFVNHQALNHPDGKPAYQRMISSKRIKEIGQYIVNGGYFPTNIIVNFTTSPNSS